MILGALSKTEAAKHAAVEKKIVGLPKIAQYLAKLGLKPLAERGESLGDGTTISLDPDNTEEDLHRMHSILLYIGELAIA